MNTRPALLLLASLVASLTAPAPTIASETVTAEAVVCSIRIAAPRDAVWRAWTERDRLVRWFGYDATVELRPGGPYEIYFLPDAPPGGRGGEGNTVHSFRPGHLLAFTWNAPPQFGPLRDERTHVLLEFSDLPGGGTVLQLTHYGWRDGADRAKVRAYFAAVWPHVLAACARHLGGEAPPADPAPADYFEFTVTEPAVAKRFYTEALGWTFTDYGPNYTSFTAGALTGGFRRGEVAAPVNPLCVIYAADLEAAAARVQSAGGRITVEPHTFPGGRRFHFTDPNGLELAVWSDRTPDGQKIP